MSYKIYDYRCEACKLVMWNCMVLAQCVDTEAEKESTKCPDCGHQMKRLQPAPPWKWANGTGGF